MSWHLAPSLVQFRAEVDKKWPKRSKKSDGTVGDASHAARRSDHNPNSRGSVNAIDITYPGVDPDVVIEAVKKHPSASYVIFNRHIYSATDGWVKKPYPGLSPHTEHLHISIKQSVKAEQSDVKWFRVPVKKVASKPKLPVYPGSAKLKVGSKNPAVKVVQTALGNPVTGTLTANDVADVKRFQRLRPRLWPADGIIGPKTYASLANNSRVKGKYRV
jgi:hypothetical protein